MGGFLEHRPVGEAFARAATNLVATYEALGRAVPKALVEASEWWCECLSRADLAFGNFAVVAIGIGPPEEGREALARNMGLAAELPAFRLFVVREGRRAGLPPARVRLQQRLALMASERVATGEPLAMSHAREKRDRDRVAQFIVRQFFGQKGPRSRGAVGEATARSPHDLLAWPDVLAPRAAAMVARSPGALGIYNVCVEPPARGGGLGTRLVAECGRIAAAEGRLATLQCESSLEPWYCSQGFHCVGAVEVFARSRTSTLDVI